jgi:hypothetical protein
LCCFRLLEFNAQLLRGGQRPPAWRANDVTPSGRPSDTCPSTYGAVFADEFNDDEELEDRRGVTRSMAPDAD